MSAVLYSKYLFQATGHLLSEKQHKPVNMTSNMEQSPNNTYLRFQTITSLA